MRPGQMSTAIDGKHYRRSYSILSINVASPISAFDGSLEIRTVGLCVHYCGCHADEMHQLGGYSD